MSKETGISGTVVINSIFPGNCPSIRKSNCLERCDASKTRRFVDPPSTRGNIFGCPITRRHIVESHDKDP